MEEKEKKRIRWGNRIRREDFVFEEDGPDHYIVTFSSPAPNGWKWRGRCSRTVLQKILWKEKPRLNDLKAVVWYLRTYGERLKKIMSPGCEAAKTDVVD